MTSYETGEQARVIRDHLVMTATDLAAGCKCDNCIAQRDAIDFLLGLWTSAEDKWVNG